MQSEHLVDKAGNRFPAETTERVKIISNNGGTPLVVSQNDKALGVIELQDIISPAYPNDLTACEKWV